LKQLNDSLSQDSTNEPEEIFRLLVEKGADINNVNVPLNSPHLFDSTNDNNENTIQKIDQRPKKRETTHFIMEPNLPSIFYARTLHTLKLLLDYGARL
jgi:ankyrin repeat protein